MDQRSEPRFSVDEPVRVTVLKGEHAVISGRVANLSGRGMRLLIDAEVPVGALIRVDVDGSMLLGEVCYCCHEAEKWALGLQMEHALTVSDDLARLMRQLIQESAPEVRQASTVKRTPYAKDS